MKLFEMSDAQLDREVELHYSKMHDDFYGYSGACCKNCRYCCDGNICEKKIDKLTDEEYEEMERTGDFSDVIVDDNDYCKEHEYFEDEPCWEEEDRYDDY